FGATSTPLGTWAVAGLGISGGVPDAPALTAAGFAFETVARGFNGALRASEYIQTWKSPTPMGVAAAGAPTLAVVGASVHLIYLAGDKRFYHGTQKLAWDSATDPVASPSAAGPVYSTGSSAASASAVGSELVIAYDGADGFLYSQSWNGSWLEAERHSTAPVSTVAPKLVALTSGSDDLMIVFVHQGDSALYSTRRSAASKVWSQPLLVGAGARSTDPVALSPLPAGGAVVLYRDADQHPYSSIYTESSHSWTTPAPVGAGANPTIASAPAVAPGVCGSDAIAVYAPAAPASDVQIVRLRAGKWSVPEGIPAMRSMAFVSVATVP
ncbi:MAG TPA: hypothetical protein VLT33_02160, partial [Labilithrix sp.]|nr:hypothetical protein [Labilithrix sp.]